MSPTSGRLCLCAEGLASHKLGGNSCCFLQSHKISFSSWTARAALRAVSVSGPRDSVFASCALTHWCDFLEN